MSTPQHPNIFLASTIAALLAFAHSPEVVSATRLPGINVTAPPPPPLIPPGGGGGFFGGGHRGGGGGGGWGGASTDTPPYYSPAPDPCGDVAHMAAHSNCDLKNPPPLTTNGCGSRGTEWVPDGVPGYRNLFTVACDFHDRCYGNWNASKVDCDVELGINMVSACNLISPSNSRALEFCTVAALTYPAALRFLPAAETAFRTAQQDGLCRYLSKMAGDLSCG